jgi:hypothetical protein
MLKLSVGGDPEGGYLVEVHDGEKFGLYRPEGVTTDVDALIAAMKDHDPELLAKVREAIPSPEAPSETGDGATNQT